MICSVHVVFALASLHVAAAVPAERSAAEGSPAQASAVGSVAIVPVAGERVSLEEVPLFERLDAALRTAATSAGVQLQAAAATRAHLAAVRDSGIDCDLSDGLCLGKVAVLADVDRLLVPIARREGMVFHVRMLAVDGTGRSREVTGDVTLLGADDDEADRASARALIDAGMAVVLADSDRPAAMATAPSEPGSAAPVATAPAATPWVGLAVLGASGAVVVGGTIGAFVVDGLLAEPEPYADRQGKMAVGQACLVAAAAGAVGVGLGAVLFAVGK